MIAFKRLSRLLVSTIFLLAQFIPTHMTRNTFVSADWDYDSANWSMTIDLLNDQAGLAWWTNYTHNGIAPWTITSDGGPATLITSDVLVISKQHRDTLELVYTGWTLEVEIFACDDTLLTPKQVYSWMLDLNIPIYNTYDCLKAILHRSDPVVVDDIMYTWTPLPETAIQIGPLNNSIIAWDCSEYQVSLSQSYYDDQTLVVVQVPYYDPNEISSSSWYDLSTIDPTLDQFPFANLVVGPIGWDGNRNDSLEPLTLSSGLIVPPYSVYRETGWDLWSSSEYGFSLCTDAWTQNGIAFEMSAQVIGSSWYTTSSDATQNTITSESGLFQSCESDVFFIITNDNEKVVEYTFSNRSVLSSDSYDPSFEINYTDTVAFLETCGLTTEQALERITIPAWFGDIDMNFISTSVTPNDVIYTRNNDFYADQEPVVIEYVSTVDFAWCTQEWFTTIQWSVSSANAKTSWSQCDTSFLTTCGDGDIQTPNSANQKEECDDWENNSNVWNCSESCIITYCGDGFIQAPNADGDVEICDNGRQNSDFQACSSRCELTFCGDGITQRLNGAGEQEECDGWEGCSDSCQWIPVCGNWRQEGEEECDQGGRNADDRQCNTECERTICGDGIVQQPSGEFRFEACDDGNDIDDDECSNVCAYTWWWPWWGPWLGLPGYVNKCMFTTTTHDADWFDHEWVAATEWATFFDNKCMDTEWPVTVNMNNEGETFYHINYHGWVDDNMRQWVYALDRIEESYEVTWTEIRTNESSAWMSETDSTWSEIYCHSSTSYSPPAYDASLLDGQIIPATMFIWDWWSTTCDSSSRWVLSTVRCLNNDANNASEWTICEDAPTRFQHRIYVEPTEVSIPECSESEYFDDDIFYGDEFEYIGWDIRVYNEAEVYVSFMWSEEPLIPGGFYDDDIYFDDGNFTGDDDFLLDNLSFDNLYAWFFWLFSQDVHAQWGDVDGDLFIFWDAYIYQESVIVDINPFASLSKNISTSFFTPFAPTTIVGWTEKVRVYDRSNESTTFVDGEIEIQLAQLDGLCPIVADELPELFTYDDQACIVSWPIPAVGEKESVEVCQMDWAMSEIIFDEMGRESLHLEYIRDGQAWVGTTNFGRQETIYNIYGDTVYRGDYLWNTDAADWNKTFTVTDHEYSVSTLFWWELIGNVTSQYEYSLPAGSVDPQLDGSLQIVYDENGLETYILSEDPAWKLEYLTIRDDKGRVTYRDSDLYYSDITGEIREFDSHDHQTTYLSFRDNRNWNISIDYQIDATYDEYGYLITWTGAGFRNDVEYSTTWIPNSGTWFRYWSQNELLNYLEVEISQDNDLEIIDEYIYQWLDDSQPMTRNRKSYKPWDLEEYQTETYTRISAENRRMWNKKSVKEDYRENAVVLEEEYLRDSLLRDRILDYRKIVSYYDVNNVLSEAVYIYDADIWGLHYKSGTEYVYDENGFILSITNKRLDEANESKTEYERTNGLKTWEQYFDYDENTNERIKQSRQSFVYNTDGYPLQQQFFEGENNERVLYEWADYIYNAEGFVTKLERYNDEWIYSTEEWTRVWWQWVKNYKEYSWNGDALELSQDLEFTLTDQGVSLLVQENCTTFTPQGTQGIIVPLYITYPVSSDTALEFTSAYELDYCWLSDQETVAIPYQWVDPNAPTEFIPLTYSLPEVTPPAPVVVPNSLRYKIPVPLATSSLITEKYLDESVIEEKGSISYVLQIQNAWELDENDIYVIDTLPEGTEIVSVITTGVILPSLLDSSGSDVTPVSQSYSCPNNRTAWCEVLFAQNVLPSEPSVQNTYDDTTIATHFTDVWTNTNGVWIPSSTPVAQVTHAAIHIPTLAVGEFALIQINVKNTDNVRWDIIKNSAATISENLLQSISNAVYTTLLPTIPNTIDGIVYEDSNSSWVLDGGENLFPWVNVFLLDQEWTLIDQTVTNQYWIYFFGDLIDGEYEVYYTPSDVSDFSAFSATAWTVDGAIVGTVNVDLVRIQDIIILDGANSVWNNFGLLADPVSVSWKIVFDDEGDMNYDGDMWLWDISVMLYDENNLLVETEITNMSGEYSFDNLVYGTYAVSYMASDTVYAPHSAHVGTIRGVDAWSTRSLLSIQEISLNPWDDSIDNDFGLVDTAKGSIAGRIFFDDEADGMYIWDVRLQWYTVYLTSLVGGSTQETTTNLNGAYVFSNLKWWAYTVSYDHESASQSYIPDSNSPWEATPNGMQWVTTNSLTIWNIVLWVSENSINNDFHARTPLP